MRSHPLLLVPALLLLLPALSAQKSKQHLLRLDFPSGKAMHYVATSSLRTTGAAGDLDLGSWLCQTIHFEWQAGPARAGVTELRQRVTRVQAEEKSRLPPNEYSYDSEAGKPAPDGAQSLAEKLGETVTTNVDARGRVVREEIPEDGKARRPDSEAGGPLPMPFEEFFIDLPEQPVAVGATWTGTWVLPAAKGRETSIEITSRLVKVERGRAHIAQTLRIADAGSGRPEDLALAADRSSGTLVLDLAGRKIVEMTMTITQVGTPPEGMPVPVRLEMVSAHALRAVPPPAAKKAKKNPPGNRRAGRTPTSPWP